VPGVSLRVVPPASEYSSLNYPLGEERKSERRLTGPDGTLICYQSNAGARCGGTCRRLFWIVPIGPRGFPPFKFEFTKEGFQTRVLALREFFKFENQAYDTAPKITTRSTIGFDEELPVWTLKVTMKRG
jgi:hypothetical protein